MCDIWAIVSDELWITLRSSSCQWEPGEDRLLSWTGGWSQLRISVSDLGEETECISLKTERPFLICIFKQDFFFICNMQKTLNPFRQKYHLHSSENNRHQNKLQSLSHCVQVLHCVLNRDGGEKSSPHQAWLHCTLLHRSLVTVWATVGWAGAADIQSYRLIQRLQKS